MKDLRELAKQLGPIALMLLWVAFVSFMVQLGLNAILVYTGRAPVPFAVVFFPALAVFVVIFTVIVILEARKSS